MNNKILIIEDDPYLMEIYAMSFDLEGYEVIRAENGKVALDLLVNQDNDFVPACILTDLQMAVMTGNTFIQILRTSYKYRFADVPIVVCSGYGTSVDTNLISEQLHKPISLDQLTAAVNRVVKSFREASMRHLEVHPSLSL
jgi:CheY-like chemotaxis protein